jgi:nucleotide-binding universal stress UspA family protein
MTTSELNTIVIAVDGSSGSKGALAWGLATAERRGAPVRLVFAFEPAMHDIRLGGGYDAGVLGDQYDAARNLLDTALQRASAQHPKLRVTALLADDSAAHALIEQSSDVDTVVMGTHGAHGFSRLVAGTTTMNVAGHAHCTVVAVPSHPDDADLAPSGGPSSERSMGPLPEPWTGPLTGHGIVVGVGGSEISQDALGHAFREAAETGEPLIAVHAWTYALTASVIGAALPLRHDPIAHEHAQDVALGEELASWSEKYPTVQVTRRIVHERPVRALTGASTGARLLVVGRRGKGARTIRLLGSVSHGVLHLATCPVAIVPKPEHPPEHRHGVRGAERST